MESEEERKIECNNDRELSCCIRIEDSIVIIVCGEVEIEKVKHWLENDEEVKKNKKPNSKLKLPYPV